MTHLLNLRQNGGVTSSFPLAKPRTPGYAPDDVDRFLADAREAYAEPAASDITSDAIRHTAFRVVRKNGYSVSHVDAALERLEEAFATQERERALAQQGEAAFYAEVRATAQEIVDRLARPGGKRFRRVSPVTVGYHPADVDAFAARLASYFQEGAPLTVATVRTIAFRPRLGGYQETQVDILLDTVIRVMLAVR